jgi:hypothetical protein
MDPGGMTREQLEHILRSACQIAGDPNVLVIGSQSILGAIPEHRLPIEATGSMEADVAFFDVRKPSRSESRRCRFIPLC